MNYEQFYYWLEGYITGGLNENKTNLIQDITNAMKTVNPPKQYGITTPHLAPINCK